MIRYNLYVINYAYEYRQLSTFSEFCVFVMLMLILYMSKAQLIYRHIIHNAFVYKQPSTFTQFYDNDYFNKNNKK